MLLTIRVAIIKHAGLELRVLRKSKRHWQGQETQIVIILYEERAKTTILFNSENKQNHHHIHYENKTFVARGKKKISGTELSQYLSSHGGVLKS